MVDQRLVAIVPNTTVMFQTITCDQYAIRFHFCFDPPISDPNTLPRTLWHRTLFWHLEVTDDVGTVYRESGGATGTQDGTRSVSPPCPLEASTLTVIVRAADGEQGAISPVGYQFEVPTSSIARTTMPSFEPPWPPDPAKVDQLHKIHPPES